MAIIDSKYNTKATDTAFTLATSGKTVCRLEAKLSRYDWNCLQSLFSFIYNSGVEAGSEQRAEDIRQALGIGGNQRG
ncbi:hypothetical protein [Enterobacter sp. DE0047]|uniref:hypothetical protein n=1 Tax=Enterobacter sp. DE0047 TaxID=2584949 RepID=UPI0011A6B455|nr:hypothetical protein [Enterobacter sp. DE0047]